MFRKEALMASEQGGEELKDVFFTGSFGRQ